MSCELLLTTSLMHFDVLKFISHSKDATVWIPSNTTYTIAHFTADGVTDVTLKIDGKLYANDDQRLWVQGNIIPDYEHPSVVLFKNCANVHLTGCFLSSLITKIYLLSKEPARSTAADISGGGRRSCRPTKTIAHS